MKSFLAILKFLNANKKLSLAFLAFFLISIMMSKTMLVLLLIALLLFNFKSVRRKILS